MSPQDAKQAPRSSTRKQNFSVSGLTRSTSNRATNTSSAVAASLPPAKRSPMRQSKTTAVSSMSAASSKPPPSNRDNNTTPLKPRRNNCPRDHQGRFLKEKPARNIVRSTTPSSKTTAKSASKIPLAKIPSIRRTTTPRRHKAPQEGFTTPSPAIRKKQPPQRQTTTTTSSSSSKRHHTPDCQSPMVLATLILEDETRDVLPRKLTVVTHIAVGNKTTFIVRLFAMMQYSHQHSPTICRWVDRGKALEIHPKHKGLGNLLARFFQHSKFLSFQRQLNNYGFHRAGDPGRATTVYYHARFHADSDPGALPTLIKYQGGKSPVKNIGSPLSSDTGSGGDGSPPKAVPSSSSPSNKDSVSPAKTKVVSSNTNAKKSPPSPPKKKQSVRESRKRRGSDPIQKPLTRRGRVKSPDAYAKPKKRRSPSPQASTPVISRASAITQFSRFHRMRNIESASTHGPYAPVTVRSSVMNGPDDPSSVSPMNETATFVHGHPPPIMAPHPPSFAFAVTGTPLVPNRKKAGLITRSFTFLPAESQPEHHPSTPQSLCSPSDFDMLSAFLETPSPTKRFKSSSGSTPEKDGFRLLFHAAEAVEHSPMLLDPDASADGCCGFSPAETASPITSLVNMDVASFRYAMDALHQGV